MRRSTLLTQVLAVNALLVGVTALIAAIVARDRLADVASGDGLLVLGLTVTSAILLNSLLLRARLEPMERLVRAMTDVDLARPGHARRGAAARREASCTSSPTPSTACSTRLEDERRESGRAVLRAQEQERSRIAQDLHDEVNQALTAILLRLSATIGDAPWGLRSELQETQELVAQAMDELLALARQLRPTALDDHGLIAALASQVARLRPAHRHAGALPPPRRHPDAVRRGAARDLPRHAGEPLEHRQARGRATASTSSCRSSAARCCACATTAAASTRTPRGAVNGRMRGRPGGLGLSGMRERALLVGGSLDVFTAPARAPPSS